MNIRKLAKIIFIGMITVAFFATPLYAKPKEDKGNNGKAKGQIHKPEKKSSPQKISQSHKSQTQKAVSVPRSAAIQKERSASQAKALRPEAQRHLERRQIKNERQLMKDLDQSLMKLDHSKWAYHPHDDRGQGNMGRVDMLDPYGHDKDSDRKELYGTRGRVIKGEIVIPEPEPEPEPPPEPEPEPPPEPEPEPPPEPETPPPTEEPIPDPDPVPEFPF